MSALNWITKSYDVVDLLLDEDNIRLDTAGRAASQDALIHDLFVNQGALEIVQSIAREGWFTHELPIVVEEKGKPIVLEGNRRLAALKAIINPALVPKMAGKIEALKELNSDLPITTVEVKVSPNREDAKRVIAIIHTKTSRRKWATLRQAYFYFAQIESGSATLEQLIETYQGVDIPRFVRMWEMHTVARSIKYDSDEETAKVANQQKFPMSTLERLYDNEQFKASYGFSFDAQGRISVSSQDKSFKEALKPVILDIINNVVNSRNLNTADDIAENLTRWNPQVKAKSGKPLTVASFKPIEPPKPTTKHVGLAPLNMVCSIPYPAMDRMLKELQRINYKNLPNAAHDLLRTVLECSLKAYFDHINEVIPPKRAGAFIQLDDVLQHAINHFQTKKRSLVQPLQTIKSNSPNKYLFSADFLNSQNHNHNMFSTGTLVKEAWDQMEPIIRYALDPK